MAALERAHLCERGAFWEIEILSEIVETNGPGAVADSRTSPVRAVVFDMDGLMFDTERLYFESETELANRRGVVFTIELAQKMMGVHGGPAMEILKAELGLAEPAEALYAECQEIFRSKVEADLQRMPGLEELLDRVAAAGLPMAVATSTHRAMTHQMLDQYNLRPRFEFLLTREDVERGKPAPDIYLKAAQLLNLKPGSVLVLEDSRNGALAAKAAGCVTVAVPHALTRMLDFSFCDLVADHLLDERLLHLAGLA